MRKRLYNRLITPYTIELYRQFLEQRPDNIRILDIGIGNGYALCQCSEVIIRKKLQIVGIDICEESLKECRRNLELHSLQFHVKVGNYKECLTKDTEVFDTAYLSDSYSVLEDPNRVIDLALSWVKTTSAIYVSLGLFKRHSRFKSYFKPKIGKVLGFDCGRYITHNMITNELLNAGACIESKEFTGICKVLGKKLCSLYTLAVVRIEDTNMNIEGTTIVEGSEVV
jgi:SAM-dependent methyltransferase